MSPPAAAPRSATRCPRSSRCSSRPRSPPCAGTPGVPQGPRCLKWRHPGSQPGQRPGVPPGHLTCPCPDTAGLLQGPRQPRPGCACCHAGPAVYPLQGPARARLPQLHPRAGRGYGNMAPGSQPVVRARGQAARRPGPGQAPPVPARPRRVASRRPGHPRRAAGHVPDQASASPPPATAARPGRGQPGCPGTEPGAARHGTCLPAHYPGPGEAAGAADRPRRHDGVAARPAEPVRRPGVQPACPPCAGPQAPAPARTGLRQSRRPGKQPGPPGCPGLSAAAHLPRTGTPATASHRARDHHSRCRAPAAGLRAAGTEPAGRHPGLPAAHRARSGIGPDLPGAQPATAVHDACGAADEPRRRPRHLRQDRHGRGQSRCAGPEPAAARRAALPADPAGARQAPAARTGPRRHDGHAAVASRPARDDPAAAAADLPGAHPHRPATPRPDLRQPRRTRKQPGTDIRAAVPAAEAGRPRPPAPPATRPGLPLPAVQGAGQPGPGQRPAVPAADQPCGPSRHLQPHRRRQRQSRHLHCPGRHPGEVLPAGKRPRPSGNVLQGPRLGQCRRPGSQPRHRAGAAVLPAGHRPLPHHRASPWPDLREQGRAAGPQRPPG